MRTPRIYTEQPLQAQRTFELEAAPSQHLARALRMQVGGELVLFDGRGNEYAATITVIDRKTVTVATAGRRDSDMESPLRIHLGIALSRGERMDWITQKATELGVSAITPLLTTRTEVKLPQERAEKKLRHWQQVAIGACEQCGRNQLPTIHPLQELDQWLASTEAQCKLVLHHRSQTPPEEGRRSASVALLIGPEGGLSGAEITAAEQAGYHSLRLGPRVLRTETAPLAAIAILQARWGDMAF
jgi:16S rRNA (uracil1498-N3)-methyltransferase